ncbi:hypothetical protein GHYDROH2_30620 [Geobacter hydrogenophilus]|uniref:Resolvase, N terminal domain n=1 Tax=Geobacter hydrogenophilus TaxID=40983 RepID=A0A9W6G2Z3_9BACT|nr:hypothetical protein GHYDROH2_30620 [Geobacter hydrogenophilus]
MGYCRFSSTQQAGDVANAEFFQAEGLQYPDPCRVAENSKSFSRPYKYLLRRYDISNGSDPFFANQVD